MNVYREVPESKDARGRELAGWFRSEAEADFFLSQRDVDQNDHSTYVREV